MWEREGGRIKDVNCEKPETILTDNDHLVKLKDKFKQTILVHLTIHKVVLLPLNVRNNVTL